MRMHPTQVLRNMIQDNDEGIDDIAAEMADMREKLNDATIAHNKRIGELEREAIEREAENEQLRVALTHIAEC